MFPYSSYFSPLMVTRIFCLWGLCLLTPSLTYAQELPDGQLDVSAAPAPPKKKKKKKTTDSPSVVTPPSTATSTSTTDSVSSSTSTTSTSEKSTTPLNTELDKTSETTSPKVNQDSSTETSNTKPFINDDVLSDEPTGKTPIITSPEIKNTEKEVTPPRPEWGTKKNTQRSLVDEENTPVVTTEKPKKDKTLAWQKRDQKLLDDEEPRGIGALGWVGIIGGSAVVLAGAGVGGYFLYQYLSQPTGSLIIRPY